MNFVYIVSLVNLHHLTQLQNPLGFQQPPISKLHKKTSGSWWRKQATADIQTSFSAKGGDHHPNTG